MAVSDSIWPTANGITAQQLVLGAERTPANTILVIVTTQLGIHVCDAILGIHVCDAILGTPASLTAKPGIPTSRSNQSTNQSLAVTGSYLPMYIARPSRFNQSTNQSLAFTQITVAIYLCI